MKRIALILVVLLLVGLGAGIAQAAQEKMDLRYHWLWGWQFYKDGKWQNVGMFASELRLVALRLLKEDPSRTLKEVAALLGRSHRTLQRWWSTYRHHGLQQLLQVSLGGGQKPLKIGEAGLKKLQQQLQTDGFADLKEIQRFLHCRSSWAPLLLQPLWGLVSGARKAFGQAQDRKGGRGRCGRSLKR